MGREDPLNIMPWNLLMMLSRATMEYNLPTKDLHIKAPIMEAEEVQAQNLYPGTCPHIRRKPRRLVVVVNLFPDILPPTLLTRSIHMPQDQRLHILLLLPIPVYKVMTPCTRGPGYRIVLILLLFLTLIITARVHIPLLGIRINIWPLNPMWRLTATNQYDKGV